MASPPLTSSFMQVAHALLNPSPFGLVIAVILALSIPIFLHAVVFRASGLTTLPSILLVGPSGSGKTSLVTLVHPSYSLALLLYVIVLISLNSSNGVQMLRLIHLNLLLQSSVHCQLAHLLVPTGIALNTIRPHKPTRNSSWWTRQVMASCGTM